MTPWSSLVVLSALHLYQASGGQQKNELLDPMKLVAFLEDKLRQLSVKPTALLIVEIGRILTRGSVSLESSLLSLRLSIYPLMRIQHSLVHVELSEAPMTPCVIKLLTSRAELQNNKGFYKFDTAMNIRHKLLFHFCVVTEFLIPPGELSPWISTLVP